MEFRQMGSSSLTVSAVGLGCNNFRHRIDDDAARCVIDAAIANGITLFDTADFYGDGGSEELLGEVLGGRRSRIVLATKCGMRMSGEPADERRGTRAYVHRAARASLRRLRTEWIDLLYLHRPDPLTPIDETLGALDELVREGLVRHIGFANAHAWRLVEADWIARSTGATPFVAVQNHYNLLDRRAEEDVVEVCERYGLGLVPYFPLANGLLTGKYRAGEALPAGSRLARDARRAATVMTDDAMRRVEALRAVAAELGVGLLEIAIGGLAAKPAVASVICGASRAEQVIANVAAGTWRPTQDEAGRIDAASPLSPRGVMVEGAVLAP